MNQSTETSQTPSELKPLVNEAYRQHVAKLLPALREKIETQRAVALRRVRMLFWLAGVILFYCVVHDVFAGDGLPPYILGYGVSLLIFGLGMVIWMRFERKALRLILPSLLAHWGAHADAPPSESTSAQFWDMLGIAPSMLRNPEVDIQGVYQHRTYHWLLMQVAIGKLSGQHQIEYPAAYLILKTNQPIGGRMVLLQRHYRAMGEAHPILSRVLVKGGLSEVQMHDKEAHQKFVIMVNDLAMLENSHGAALIDQLCKLKEADIIRLGYFIVADGEDVLIAMGSRSPLFAENPFRYRLYHTDGIVRTAQATWEDMEKLGKVLDVLMPA